MSTMALGINDRVQVMSLDDIGTTMHGFVQNASTGKYRSSARLRSNGLNDFGQIVRFYIDSNRKHRRLCRHAEVAVAGHSEL